MGNERPDVLEILEENKQWHQTQIDRINLAISVLKGEEIPNKPKLKKTSTPSGISWALEIDKVYQKYPTEVFTLADVCQKLAEQGVTEALDASRRNIINVALARKVRQGKLVREGPGLYKKKLSRASLFLENVNGLVPEKEKR